MCFGECVVLIFRVKRLLFGDIVSGGCLAKRLFVDFAIRRDRKLGDLVDLRRDGVVGLQFGQVLQYNGGINS